MSASLASHYRSVARLRALNILYSKGVSGATDAEYDALYDATKDALPDHSFFDKVGSEYGVEYALPVKMGSLNKIRPDDVSGWMTGISKNSPFALTPKLDGVAVLLEYDSGGKFVRALTRGDGHKGQDVTNSLKYVRNFPVMAYTYSCRMYVRGELIISKSSFTALQGQPKFTYVNARNALVGCLNAKQKSPIQADVLRMAEFFAFDVTFMVDEDRPGSAIPKLPYRDPKATVIASKAPKAVQFAFLKKQGFFTVCDTVSSGNLAHFQSDMPPEKITQSARTTIHNLKSINYECDGIVIEADSEKLKNLGVEANGVNPKGARAIKLDPSEQEAKIIKVSRVNWERTPRGIYKPVVELAYEARFQGVRVRNVYVDNAGWVKRNRVGHGSMVAVIRSGDVIPRIIEVTQPAEKQEVKIPKKCRKHGEKLVWTETNTDLYCPVCSGEMNSPAEFFKQLAPDNIGKTLVDHVCKATGVTTVPELLSLTPVKLKNIDKFSTKRSVQFHGELQRVMAEASLAKLMHSSGAFRSPTLGLGETRLQSIIDHIGADILMKNTASPADLAHMAERVDGIGKLVARCFGDQFRNFYNFFDTIRPWAKAALDETSGKKSTGVLSGRKFVFTGFRNKIAEATIKREGGTVSNSINKATSVLFSASQDTIKAKKAIELGVKVVSGNQTEEYLNKLIAHLRKKLGLPLVDAKPKRKNMKRPG